MNESAIPDKNLIRDSVVDGAIRGTYEILIIVAMCVVFKKEDSSN
jgi:hypothetical protein